MASNQLQRMGQELFNRLNEEVKKGTGWQRKILNASLDQSAIASQKRRIFTFLNHSVRRKANNWILHKQHLKEMKRCSALANKLSPIYEIISEQSTELPIR